jgi:predicted transcriptional regulator YheO
MSPALRPFIPVCDAIAVLFHPHAEVVLHDLASQQIVYIANTYSRRRPGDSSLTEPAPAFDTAEDVIGPYGKTNWNGRRLKSVTAVLRDAAQRPIGLLCINYDVEAFVGLLDHLRPLIELPSPAAQPAPLFAPDWRESVHLVVARFLSARNTTLAGLSSDDLDGLLAELGRQGIFEIRKAVPYVAEVLHLSRATIYKRLGALRQREAALPGETGGRL